MFKTVIKLSEAVILVSTIPFFSTFRLTIEKYLQLGKLQKGEKLTDLSKNSSSYTEVGSVESFVTECKNKERTMNKKERFHFGAYWYTSKMSPLTASLLMLGAEIQPVNSFILVHIGTPVK